MADKRKKPAQAEQPGGRKALARFEDLVADPELLAAGLEFGSGFQEKVVSISEMGRSAKNTTIMQNYGIGQLVVEMADQFSSRAVKLAAKILDKKEAVLYSCAVVARTFNERDLTTLLSRRGRPNYELQWSHLVVLASEKRPVQRAELIDRAFAEGWTVDAIAAHVVASTTSGRGKGAKGAPVHRPTSFLAALDGLYMRSTSLGNFADTLTDEAGIVELALKLEADALDPHLVSKFDSTLEAVDKLAERIDAIKESLAEVQESINGRLRTTPSLPEKFEPKAKASLPAPKKSEKKPAEAENKAEAKAEAKAEKKSKPRPALDLS